MNLYIYKNEAVDDEQMEFFLAALTGVETSIWAYVNRNLASLTPEKTFAYYMNLFFTCFGFSAGEIQNIMTGAVEIARHVEIRQDRTTYQLFQKQ